MKRTYSFTHVADMFSDTYATLEELIEEADAFIQLTPSKRPEGYHGLMLIGTLMSLGWVVKTERGFRVEGP